MPRLCWGWIVLFSILLFEAVTAGLGDTLLKLKSTRLDLRPLTLAQLSLAELNYAGLERDFDLNASGTVLDDEMLYAMQVRHSRVLQDPLNYPWLTNWAVIQREEQRLIGFIILKGCPNDQGEVIVGYTINESHRRQGYATEALQCICGWIFSDPRALWVIADTEKDNAASHKVLRHLGAQKHREAEELIWWRIARPGTQAPAEIGV